MGKRGLKGQNTGEIAVWAVANPCQVVRQQNNNVSVAWSFILTEPLTYTTINNVCYIWKKCNHCCTLWSQISATVLFDI